TKGCLIANFATVPTKLAREFGISRETLYQYLRTDQ
ncbi:helix-turn-helix domain-containing protein, partial [Escherichia coli]